MPDFVFLAHVVDVTHSLHVQFVLRWTASLPQKFRPFIIFMWPGAFLVMLMMWAWSKTFLISSYTIRDKLHQIWAVPRYGFQVRLEFSFFMRCMCTIVCKFCRQGIDVQVQFLCQFAAFNCIDLLLLHLICNKYRMKKLDQIND